MELELSNSLVDLAARIRAEHQATSDALKKGAEHAMAAGDLLIEAKSKVPHGRWLPWLEKHCSMSERTAQLYMRTAKNRVLIETQIRNGVADLSLNEAAALLMLTSDVKQLLLFAHQVQSIGDPEELIRVCVENGIGVIQDSGYDPASGRTEEEVREWHLFMLFLAQKCGYMPDGASRHVEWIIQRPFQNVPEWLSEEGDKFRKRTMMTAVPQSIKDAWQVYASERTSLTEGEIVRSLEASERTAAW
jgi:hypothetical protein